MANTIYLVTKRAGSVTISVPILISKISLKTSLFYKSHSFFKCFNKFQVLEYDGKSSSAQGRNR